MPLFPKCYTSGNCTRPRGGSRVHSACTAAHAVTVCTYPSKLIHTLAGRLDLVLPGEDRDSIDILDSLHFVRPTRRWWWRAPLAHERPRMIFHEVTMTKFRGPAFTEEIKVSACPAHIALFADGAGNWRIALIPSPNALADSQTLFLDIPGHMLIVLLRHLISGQEKLNLATRCRTYTDTIPITWTQFPKLKSPRGLMGIYQITD